MYFIELGIAVGLKVGLRRAEIASLNFSEIHTISSDQRITASVLLLFFV